MARRRKLLLPLQPPPLKLPRTPLAPLSATVFAPDGRLLRVLRHIGSTLVSGFIFRPFVMLLLPGLLLMAFSLYVNFWVAVEFVNALQAGPMALHEAAMVIYRDHPQTLFIGVLSLVLAIQLVSLGAVSLQNMRYFNDAYYMGVELRRALERPQCGAPADPE